MRCAALLLLFIVQPVMASQTIRVAVAANFKPPLETISKQFMSDTGHKILFSSASTGILSNQLLHGAPFDLFFAADRKSPAKISSAGIGEAPFCYALGQLSLVGGDGELAQLGDPRLSLAIANPVTAPYGRAALEILKRPEFSSAVDRKLVRGNNAVQAYQFWHSGTVDLALIPRSLAPANATAIPQQWYQPLEQHAVVLNRSEAVNAYLQWLAHPDIRARIIAAGYLPCP